MSVDEHFKIKNYINEVCSFIKFKEAHGEVSKELVSHIEDIYDEYMNEGMAEEDALDKSISRMGSSEEVGKQLNLAHKGAPDWITLILTMILVNIGVVLMYIMNKNNLVSNLDYIFTRSLLSAFIGTILIIILYFFDYKRLRKYSKYVFFSVIVLYLLLVFNLFYLRTDAARKIIAITPYILIVSLAGMFTHWDWSNTINLFKGILILIVPTAFMLLFCSTSSAIIYFVGFFILALNSNMKLRYAVLTFIVSVLSVVFFFFSEPYRLKRLLTFLNPESDTNGAGYLNMQIKNIINSTGFTGNGFSFPKNSLPEVHSELIFNYVLYSLGWVGAIILIILIAAFVIRLISITKVIRDTYGKLLIKGLIAVITVQFILNILMNLNLTPIIGMPLPFISYGGTLSLSNMISIGLILSVYRRRSLTSKEQVVELLTVNQP